ncbi:MAG: hypothetical protein QM669_02785 [Siphonobacter sp.]
MNSERILAYIEQTYAAQDRHAHDSSLTHQVLTEVNRFLTLLLSIRPPRQMLVLGNSLFLHNLSHYQPIILKSSDQLMCLSESHFDSILLNSTDQQILNNCVDLLTPGGLFIAEDSLLATLDDDIPHSMLPYVAAQHRFNQAVAQHPNLSSTILPIGYGLTVAIKKA